MDKGQHVSPISAWLNSSLDSEKGTGRNANSFWGQVAKKFLESTGINMKPNTLKSYWNTKKPQVKAFDGCYKRATDLNKSSWSDEMYIDEAHQFYAQEHEREFTLLY